MHVNKISVRYSRKWATAQYESLEEEVYLFAVLDEDENPVESAQVLQAMAQDLVLEHARPLLERCGKIQPRRRQKVSGLEVEPESEDDLIV